MVKTHRKRSSASKTRKHKKSCKYPATMYGLNKWSEHVFEELGWMVLANKKGYNDKVNTYKMSVKRLIEHLECKISSVDEKDRKDDLKILLDNAHILMSHVEKDF